MADRISEPYFMANHNLTDSECTSCSSWETSPVTAETMKPLLQLIQTEVGPRYQIQSFLGQGGFATVWKALDLVTQELVAVKRFEPQTNRGGLFYREMRAMFRLNHPRIVRIINLLEVPDGSRYLILEYCRGGNLRSFFRRLKKRPDPCRSEEVGVLAQALTEGLHVAHEIGLIHRDLKPENVLFEGESSARIDPHTHIKLADFGLARILNHAHHNGSIPTALVGLSGSPAYMSPEHFSGEYTTASDLYSLGVVLYECWHGHPPFVGSAETLAYQHIREEPEFDNELPESWRRILSRLLAKEPNLRPTAKSLLSELHQISSPIERNPGSDTTNNSTQIWERVPKSALALIHAHPDGCQVVWNEGITCLQAEPFSANATETVPGIRKVIRVANGNTLLLRDSRIECRNSVGSLSASWEFDPPVDIASLIPGHTESPRLATISGEELALWDRSPAQPIWTRTLRISGLAPCLVALANGNLVCAEGPVSPRLVVWSPDGTVETLLSLPGPCWQLLLSPVNECVYANLLLGSQFQAFRVDFSTGNLVALGNAEDLQILAETPNPSVPLVGLRGNGSVIGWDAQDHDFTMAKIAGPGLRFRDLLCDGTKVAVLAREQHNCKVIIEPCAIPTSKEPSS